MLNIPTADKLRSLKLHGMVKGFDEQLASTEYNSFSFEERLGLLIDREATERENRRLAILLRQAKLKQQACMEDIDYAHARGLDRSLMKSLSNCQWIKEGLNVLITGSTGAGKSFIACALAHKACLLGFKALYFRTTRLFGDLGVARGDGRYNRIMKQIAKADLIIIDDWGLCSLDAVERRDMLEIMDDRHGVHSTIIAGQLPIDHWHEVIGDPTLADAILDRLVHNAYKINLTGESMRKKKTKLT